MLDTTLLPAVPMTESKKNGTAGEKSKDTSSHIPRWALIIVKFVAAPLVVIALILLVIWLIRKHYPKFWKIICEKIRCDTSSNGKYAINPASYPGAFWLAGLIRASAQGWLVKTREYEANKAHSGLVVFRQTGILFLNLSV